MNYKKFFRQLKLPALTLAVLALAAAPSFAQTTYNLCASDGTVTIGAAVIPIWGYADIGAGTCTTGLATLPGPELRATAGGTLTINLSNALASNVSFFVPGYRATVAGGTAGMLTDEVAPAGTATYTISARAGTYLYHSGTDITTQVPMGLYGALVVDQAPNCAYDDGIDDCDVPYAQDEVLVYSAIDPNLNNGTNPDARVTTWNPQYFLINGAAHPDTVDINVSTSQKTLLRFVNAGLDTVVPTLDGGLYMDLIAEDGNRYPQPLQQYGIELPAGKTIDAIINPGSDGTYALYDRAASYDSDVTDIIAGAAIGAPTAVDDPAIPGDYTIAEGGSLTTFAAGSPAGVLDNDTSGAGPGPFTANLVSDVSAGTLALNGDGSFTYTPNAFFSGSDTFTYVANDGALDSNVATVTITVTPVNDPPVANDDTATTPPEVAVTIDVVANDTDPDGNLDPTTTNTTCLTGTPVCSTPTNGALLNNGDGTFTYTPNSLFAGTDSFVYEVCDTGLPVFCDTATVNITVINNQPVANDDEATTALNTAVIVDVVANDTDVDDNLDPTSVTVTTPATSGSAVPNGDGTITYTPNTDFFGTDTFVYQVCDTGLLCDTATVTITVENAPPVANDDFATVDKNSGAADLANTFSVTANDVDTDGTIDVTTVVITTGANTQRGGTVVENNDGTVTYTPKRGFRGTDTFQYTVDDNLGATSEDPATVRMNVR